MVQIGLFSFGAFLTTLLGCALAWGFSGRPQVKSSLSHLLAVGSGLLLGSAFFFMIPEAIRNHPRFPNPGAMGMAAAFLLLFALETTTMVHSCAEYVEECQMHIVGWGALLALAIHSLSDGLAIGSAFRADSRIGFIASSAVIAHKISDGFALFLILLAAGFSRKKSLFAILALALATPLGAVLAGWSIAPSFGGLPTIILPSQVEPGKNSLLAVLLGFSAGSFIYIAAGDILPRLHRMRQAGIFLLFLAGVALSFIAGRWIWSAGG